MDALKPGEYEKVAVRRSKESMRRSLNTASLFNRFTTRRVSFDLTEKANGGGERTVTCDHDDLAQPLPLFEERGHTP